MSKTCDSDIYEIRMISDAILYIDEIEMIFQEIRIAKSKENFQNVQNVNNSSNSSKIIYPILGLVTVFLLLKHN